MYIIYINKNTAKLSRGSSDYTMAATMAADHLHKKRWGLNQARALARVVMPRGHGRGPLAQTLLGVKQTRARPAQGALLCHAAWPRANCTKIIGS